MTENEAKAIRFIENIKNHAVVTLDHIVKEEPNVSPLIYKGREEKADTILTMIEELEQYRTIGKPMEIKQKLEELERWHTYRLAENVKNPFAKMSTSICHNCDHKDDYIEELEAEVKEYRAIGTVEECRAAVKKQTIAKPIYNDKRTCPSCYTHHEVWEKRRKTVGSDIVHCWHCRQAVEIKRGNEE